MYCCVSFSRSLYTLKVVVVVVVILVVVVRVVVVSCSKRRKAAFCSVNCPTQKFLEDSLKVLYKLQVVT